MLLFSSFFLLMLLPLALCAKDYYKVSRDAVLVLLVSTEVEGGCSRLDD